MAVLRELGFKPMIPWHPDGLMESRPPLRIRWTPQRGEELDYQGCIEELQRLPDGIFEDFLCVEIEGFNSWIFGEITGLSFTVGNRREGIRVLAKNEELDWHTDNVRVTLIHASVEPNNEEAKTTTGFICARDFFAILRSELRKDILDNFMLRNQSVVLVKRLKKLGAMKVIRAIQDRRRKLGSIVKIGWDSGEPEKDLEIIDTYVRSLTDKSLFNAYYQAPKGKGTLLMDEHTARINDAITESGKVYYAATGRNDGTVAFLNDRLGLGSTALGGLGFFQENMPDNFPLHNTTLNPKSTGKTAERRVSIGFFDWDGKKIQPR